VSCWLLAVLGAGHVLLYTMTGVSDCWLHVLLLLAAACCCLLLLLMAES